LDRVIPAIGVDARLPLELVGDVTAQVRRTLRGVRGRGEATFLNRLALLDAVAGMLSEAPMGGRGEALRRGLPAVVEALHRVVFTDLVRLGGTRRRTGLSGVADGQQPEALGRTIGGLPAEVGLAMEGLAPAVNQLARLPRATAVRLLNGVRDAVVLGAVRQLLPEASATQLAEIRNDVADRWNAAQVMAEHFGDDIPRPLWRQAVTELRPRTWWQAATDNLRFRSLSTPPEPEAGIRPAALAPALTLVDGFAGAMGAALAQLRVPEGPQGSDGRSADPGAGPLDPHPGDLSGQLGQEPDLSELNFAGFSGLPETDPERQDYDAIRLPAPAPGLLWGLDPQPVHLGAPAAESIRRAARDGRIPPAAGSAALSRLDEVLGTADWGVGPVVSDLAALAALGDVLRASSGGSASVGEPSGSLARGDAASGRFTRRADDARALRAELDRRQQDLVRRWVTPLAADPASGQDFDPETRALQQVVAGLTDTVTQIARSWLAPVPEPVPADGVVAEAGPATSGPAVLVRALRDAAREAVRTMSDSEERGERFAEVLRQPSGPFGDLLWDRIGSDVDGLRAIPSTERDFRLGEIRRQVEVAGRMLDRLMNPEAAIERALDRLEQRQGHLSRDGMREVAPQHPGPAPVRGSWLGRIGAVESGAPTTQRVVRRAETPAPSVETHVFTPAPTQHAQVDVVQNQVTDTPDQVTDTPDRTGDDLGGGKPDPARLGWTWGVIKGTALPPDEQWWQQRRQGMLAGVATAAKATAPKPIIGPISPASSVPSGPPAGIGPPSTIAGYADGTAVLSWAELSSHTLAPGVLIRLRSSLPTSSTAPSMVAHKAVLVFAAPAQGRAPGTAGPYIIQSVIYDAKTDTYYVRLA
jgi:hypothetical protein